MIARSWHGAVPIKKAEAFRHHLLKTGVSEAKATPGNLGAYIYSRPQDDLEHFFMVSYWDNIESIKAFAGLDPHIAVTYPGDEQYGLISDPIVVHHMISEIPGGFPVPFK